MTWFLRFIIVCALLTSTLPGWSAAALIKVACIGDSITEGAGLGNRSYPSKLGSLLGDEYQVRNFGVSGRTLLKKGDFPYWKESQYQESLSWEPDIVIIKLGTNDSKPQNWSHGEEYVGDFEELINSYNEQSSQPRIILATPCPVFGAAAFPISHTIVADEIAPAVRELAIRLELELIDYHDQMADLSSLFPDTVHPDARGTTVMASQAYEVIAQIDPQLARPNLTIKKGTFWATLEWPINAAGYVLQERATYSGTRGRWRVTQSETENDGSMLRLEVSLRGPHKFYRLWRP